MKYAVEHYYYRWMNECSYKLLNNMRCVQMLVYLPLIDDDFNTSTTTT